MYCCLPTELQRKLSKMLKVTYIIMIIYYVMPMIPLYNGSYLFPLSRSVNLNRLIFDPSEVDTHQYQLKVFVFKLNKTHIYQTAVVEKH